MFHILPHFPHPQLSTGTHRFPAAHENRHCDGRWRRRLMRQIRPSPTASGILIFLWIILSLKKYGWGWCGSCQKDTDVVNMHVLNKRWFQNLCHLRFDCPSWKTDFPLGYHYWIKDAGRDSVGVLHQEYCCFTVHGWQSQLQDLVPPHRSPSLSSWENVQETYVSCPQHMPSRKLV